MYFLYTWCTTEYCNRIGRIPICRNSMVKGADDLRNAPPICCPRAIILPRSTKKHTHTVSTKPFEAATCSDGLCVQLYKSITYSKKEKNTKNSVIFMPTFLFSSKKKFSATAQLSPAESSSKGVFRRVLHHNIEFLSISTLIFYIHTLSTTKKFLSVAMCNIIRKTQCYGLGL